MQEVHVHGIVHGTVHVHIIVVVMCKRCMGML